MKAKSGYSIHRRLRRWLIAGVGLLLLTAGVVLDIVVGRQLLQQYDHALLAKARALVTLTEQDEKGIELDLGNDVMTEFADARDPEYFQLWLVGDDSVIERSASLAEDQHLPRLSGRSETARLADLILPDGRNGRYVQIDFLPHIDTDEDDEDDEDTEDHSDANNANASSAVFVDETMVARPLTLVVARERERLDDLLTTLRLTLLITGLIVMVLIIVLVRLAVGSSLQPLADIRDQVTRLNADSLDARLDPARRVEELDEVVAQFNAMLDRLQAAFERERRFSADVAHELRTPLAELRNLAEVGSRWPDDPVLVRDFFNEILAASRQIERIVVNLLALARCEKGLTIIERSELDLAALIDAAWQRVWPEAQAKQLSFNYDGPATVILHSDRDQFDLILNNLFSNAAAYSPAGSTVTCRVEQHGQSVRLSIANRAEHLQTADLPHLFDRMWRKDPARTGGYHAGLGLSLVKAYAEQLKLAVDVALEPDRVFRITLSVR